MAPCGGRDSRGLHVAYYISSWTPLCTTHGIQVRTPTVHRISYLNKLPCSPKASPTRPPPFSPAYLTVTTQCHISALQNTPHTHPKPPPPDAQPHRAASPHAVPRDTRKSISSDSPCPPSTSLFPARGLPVLTEPHRARHGACHSRLVSDAGRSSRTSSEVTHLPRPPPSPGHHT